jgi:hypothetical protein
MRPVEMDVGSLFSLESGELDALESFISERLFDANVWESPRTSDGIEQLRIVEREPERLRVCGRIFAIDQTLHCFWLDIERSDGGVTWALYFEAITESPRRERNAIATIVRHQDIVWQVALSGHAQVRDGVPAAT